MRFTRSSGRAMSAAATALALCFLSAPISRAQQTPADPLKFDTSASVLIVWSVKPDKAKEFLNAWAQIREVTAKSTLPDVQEFGKTLAAIARLQPESPLPGAPVEYATRIMRPSTTQSYHPGKIVYELLFLRQEIGRAHADAMYSVFKDCIVEIQTYARMR